MGQPSPFKAQPSLAPRAAALSLKLPLTPLTAIVWTTYEPRVCVPQSRGYSGDAAAFFYVVGE